MSYRYLFSSPRADHSAEQLIDTMVELLVRLHLAGVFWGDCSLSNTLFRPDAGSISAYLVDAETVERHESLSPGQRNYDVELAMERVAAELMDLESGGLLPEEIDPIEMASAFPQRYEALWDEVTREEVFQPSEQRYRIADRLQRLNELGFAVDEVELITCPDGGVKLRVHTRVAESGQHRREFFRLTGLEVGEQQARRLLNDLRSFRAWLEQRDGRSVPETVAGPPLGGRGVPADHRRDPRRPGRPAGAGGGVPRDPGAPLVPVGEGRPGRGDDGGREVLLRDGAPADPEGSHDAVGDRRACCSGAPRPSRTLPPHSGSSLYLRRNAPGRAMDSRRRTGIGTRTSDSRRSPSARSSCTAAVASSRCGSATLERGGWSQTARSESSKEITETSAGTERPRTVRASVDPHRHPVVHADHRATDGHRRPAARPNSLVGRLRPATVHSTVPASSCRPVPGPRRSRPSAPRRGDHPLVRLGPPARCPPGGPHPAGRGRRPSRPRVRPARATDGRSPARGS